MLLTSYKFCGISPALLNVTPTASPATATCPDFLMPLLLQQTSQ
ncbi:MAG: hypothetical protein ACUVRZ_04455 [Desulfobacca sp.]